MLKSWTLVLVALLLLLVVRADDAENVEPESEKEAFVASKFVEPKLKSEDGSTIYMWEYFRGRGAIGKSWLKSKAKKDDVDTEISKYNGDWEITTPSEVSIEGDYSLVVKTAARHHAISSKLTTPFIFTADKTLVMQYEVRFEDGQNCGGSYVKLLSEGAEKDLEQFNDKTGYTIMFGPDKCAPTGKIHLIFRYRNPKNGTVSEHHAKQPDSIASSYWDDHKTHLYTLFVKPDGAYSVTVDYTTLFYGNMLKDLIPAIEPPKEIADPEDLKPEDWDEREQIEDETATKPDDWDENAPKEIVDEAAMKPSDWLEDEQSLLPDPEAVKPEDWDQEMDGDWEPPMIENPLCKGISGCGEWKRPVKANPEYKGKWRRPKIANPAYKGIWRARTIDNPNHFEPTAFGGLATISALGLELWTMSKDILFDNILISDSEATATEAAKLTFDVRKAEDARLRASQGEGAGIFRQLVDATEERPWLWAVYVLSILVPVILIGVFCFGRQSKSEPGYLKKHDVIIPDDEDVAPILVDDEGNEVVDDQDDDAAALDDAIVKNLEEKFAEEPPVVEKKSPGRGRKTGGSPARKSPARKSPARAAATASKKKTARELIEEDNSTEDDEKNSNPSSPEIEQKVSPALKKRGRPKKAD